MEKQVVVLGEASESEEDEESLSSLVGEKKKKSTKNSGGLSKGTTVAGEASESDNESEDGFRQAFFARKGATQDNIEEDHQEVPNYDTLLHKKLRECNVSLHNNVCSQSQLSLMKGIKAANRINQQLVLIQIQVQDAATSISKAYENITKLSDSLNSILATPYIPEINIV